MSARRHGAQHRELAYTELAMQPSLGNLDELVLWNEDRADFSAGRLRLCPSMKAANEAERSIHVG